MSLHLLSISNLAGTERGGPYDSNRIGVVEAMCLVACDKVIYQKIKWILAMDMAAAAKPPQTELESVDQVSVVMETQDPTNITKMHRLKNPEKSIDDLEKNLFHYVSVLYQLLRRYQLLQRVSDSFQIHDPASPSHALSIDAIAKAGARVWGTGLRPSLSLNNNPNTFKTAQNGTASKNTQVVRSSTTAAPFIARPLTLNVSERPYVVMGSSTKVDETSPMSPSPLAHTFK
ncbi:hypothetical protein HDU76_004847 [Blyttiomyces sp. JEL0837]|nr:hypothetical protein HDU76_004847 [Blyttiomyces sp. JEL0837]